VIGKSLPGADITTIMLKNLGTQTKSLLPLIHKQIANPITRWSNGLRKKPVIAALQELEQFVADLLANQKEPAKLLNIIESIRSDLHQINAGSESIVNLEGAIACPRATDCEVKIYEQIMKLSSSAGNDIFALALHRCIAASIQRQLVYYYSYLPVPEKEWQRIHRLFYEAIQKNISHFVAVDKIYFIGRKLSILNLYSMSLLLGCGRLNHLSTEDISRVFKNMPNWCTLVGISSNPDGSSGNSLVVDLNTSSAPHFKKEGSLNGTTCLYYLKIEKLIENLDRLLSNETKTFSLLMKKIAVPAFSMESQVLNPDVIQHLKLAWTESSDNHQAIKTNENILVCCGFESIFFYLTGGKTLKEFIGDKASFSILYSQDSDVTSIEKHRSGDIWSSFLSVPIGIHVLGRIPEKLHFQNCFVHKNQAQKNTDPPVLTLNMIDSSPDGCRLLWTNPSSASPDVGELVGLCTHASNRHWQVGEIAWKDQSSAGEITMGIHILSTIAIPIAVDVPLRHGSHENYTCGMLFPPEEQLGTETVSFALSSLELQQGEYVAISQKGIDEKIYLNKSLKANPFFESYECAFVVNTSLV